MFSYDLDLMEKLWISIQEYTTRSKTGVNMSLPVASQVVSMAIQLITKEVVSMVTLCMARRLFPL